MKEKHRHITKCIVAFALAICMVLGSIPVLPNVTKAKADDYPQVGSPELGIGKIGNPKAPEANVAWTGSYVYFGKYAQSENDTPVPVRYRVLDNNTTKFSMGTTEAEKAHTMLLDCDNILFTDAFRDNDQAADANVWSTSDLYTVLNNKDNSDSFINTSFSKAEETAIIGSNIDAHPLTTDSSEAGVVNVSSNVQSFYVSYVALMGEKIFLLDIEDTCNNAYGYETNDVRCESRKKKDLCSETKIWLLRSGSPKVSIIVAQVDLVGFLHYNKVNDAYGVSPAFNINRSSVIFSSLIRKDENSSEAGAYGAEYKLTVMDPGMIIEKNSDITISGNTITIPYKITVGNGNTYSRPERVSAVVTDGTWSEKGWSEGAKILQYTKLADITSTDDEITGTASISLDSSITGTMGVDYHVYILAEDVNGTYETDYATEPLSVSTQNSGKYGVTVENGSSNLGFASLDQTVSIQANEPAEGKVFVGWTSNDGVVFADSASRSTTFTMPAKAVTVTANYADGYKVTVVDGDASPDFAAEGATVTINAKDIDNMIFSKWTSEDGITFADANASSTTFTMPAKAVTVTANYVDGYKVTVVDGDASPDFAAEGTTVTVNAKDIDNMKFSNWTSEDGITFADANAASTTFTMPAKAVSVKANYVEDPAYWYCGAEGDGSNVTWSINEAGDTLIISGTGTMASYGVQTSASQSRTSAPWRQKLDELKYLVIGSGITEIGDYAFVGNHFKTITIPGNVKKIGDDAFRGDSCESLTIEEGVEYIGSQAFGFGAGKPTVIVPKSVKYIDKLAFFKAGDVILCGDGIEFTRYPFSGIEGTVYASATMASTKLESRYGVTNGDDLFDVVYICQVPETEKFVYTGSEISAFETEANPGYTVSGNKGTAIGNYTATFKLNDTRVLAQENGRQYTAKYVWGDLSEPDTWKSATDTADKTVAWSIVEPVVLSSIAVTTAPKTTYTEGESFDATGMVVTATYSDGTIGTVTGYTCTPLDKLATTDKAVTVSYTEDGVTVTTTLGITVNPIVYVTVQIIPGKNMDGAHVGASGALVQNVALGTEIDVVGFQFNEDFDGYIPENYTVEQVNGITVKCVRGENGIGIIEISGKPTADVIIQLPDAGSKKADEEAKKNNTGSENGGTDSNNNSSDSGNGGTESNNGGSGYTDGGSGSNSSYNGGSSNYSGGSGTTSGGSGNTGSANAGSGNKNGSDTNTSGSGAATNPDTKVKENSDGTKTETVVKNNDDGSTVKTQTTKDAEGKVLQTVTQKTETTTDGSTVTTKSTENNDGTYTTSTKTEKTDGTTVTKTESKDAEGTIISKEVTKTKDSTVTVEETKTEAGDVYTKETTKTAESTVISENTETADGTVSTKVTTKTSGSTTVEEKISSADDSTIVRKSVTDKKGTSTVNETKTDKKGNVTTTEETVKKNGTGSSKSVTVDKNSNEISTTSTETKKDKKGTLTVTSETVNKNAEGSEVKSVESSVKFFKSGEVKTETTEKSADGSSVTTKNTINVDENGNLAVVSEVTEIDAEGKETTSTTSVTVEVDESGKPVLSEIATDGKTAVIPDVVVSDGQIVPVTSIGDGAMKGNKKVTDVKLGKNITEIGAKAFYKDKKLKNIGLTGYIRTIEKKAFKGTAKDAVFTISATSKKEFKRVKKLVIKAGASKNATFVYEKESK